MGKQSNELLRKSRPNLCTQDNTCAEIIGGKQEASWSNSKFPMNRSAWTGVITGEQGDLNATHPDVFFPGEMKLRDSLWKGERIKKRLPTLQDLAVDRRFLQQPKDKTRALEDEGATNFKATLDLTQTLNGNTENSHTSLSGRDGRVSIGAKSFLPGDMPAMIVSLPKLRSSLRQDATVQVNLFDVSDKGITPFFQPNDEPEKESGFAVAFNEANEPIMTKLQRIPSRWIIKSSEWQSPRKIRNTQVVPVETEEEMNREEDPDEKADRPWRQRLMKKINNQLRSSLKKTSEEQEAPSSTMADVGGDSVKMDEHEGRRRDSVRRKRLFSIHRAEKQHAWANYTDSFASNASMEHGDFSLDDEDSGDDIDQFLRDEGVNEEIVEVDMDLSDFFYAASIADIKHAGVIESLDRTPLKRRTSKLSSLTEEPPKPGFSRADLEKKDTVFDELDLIASSVAKARAKAEQSTTSSDEKLAPPVANNPQEGAASRLIAQPAMEENFGSVSLQGASTGDHDEEDLDRDFLSSSGPVLSRSAATKRFKFNKQRRLKSECKPDPELELEPESGRKPKLNKKKWKQNPMKQLRQQVTGEPKIISAAKRMMVETKKTLTQTEEIHPEPVSTPYFPAGGISLRHLPRETFLSEELGNDDFWEFENPLDTLEVKRSPLVQVYDDDSCSDDSMFLAED